MKKEDFLPKGFTNTLNKDLENKYEIIQLLREESQSIYTEFIEFPPVAFLDTFTKAASITGDKIYQFKDKKGRDLVLTPDSQGLLFNHYLSTEDVDKSARYTWISPTFRYRNVENRHFYQIGFASINHSIDFEVSEVFFCVKKTVEFIRKLIPHPVKLILVNPGLIKEITNSILQNENKTDIEFEKLRVLSNEDRKSAILEIFPDSVHRDILLSILKSNTDKNQIIHLIAKYKEGEKIKKLLRLIESLNHVEYELELGNMYCSEILSGMGFIMEIEGRKIGDGGVYNLYGAKFNARVKTIVSACTGVTAISRFLCESQRASRVIKIFIHDLNVNELIALSLVTNLGNRGYKICLYPFLDGQIKKYIQKEDLVVIVNQIEIGKIITGKLFMDISHFNQDLNNYTFADLDSLISEQMMTIL
jgi:histidyl-tRNA synthetase